MLFGLGARKDGSSGDGDRVPPGQRVTAGFPVLHHGEVPYYRDMGLWNLRLFGLVEEDAEISYKEFMQLPRQQFGNDIHCVTTWSKLDNVWVGLGIIDEMGPDPL